MRKPIQKNSLEEKAHAMAEGFRAFPFPNTELVFRGETMLPAQAAARFQVMLDSFQGVRDAEAARSGAVAAHEKDLADHQAFYEDAVVVVKSHFGSDPKRLATFGLSPAKRSRRPASRPAETVIERRVEEVIERRDGTVEVRETETIRTGEDARRRERDQHPRMGPGAVQVEVPPKPASPAPAVPAAVSPAPAAKSAKPSLARAKSTGHRRAKRVSRAQSRGS